MPLSTTDDVEDGIGKKIMLLFVVGGVTFLEIAALRYLSKNPNFPYTIIISSTKIINGI